MATSTSSRSPAQVPSSQRMFWLFPLVLCLDSGYADLQSNLMPLVVNGVLGESITLPLTLPAEQIRLIIWNHNEKPIIITMIKELKDPEVVVLSPMAGNRLNVTQSYSLQLSDLKMADTGSYTSQITTINNFLTSSYALRVFRRLSNLHITNHTQLSENGTCEMHLTCSVEDPDYTGSIGWQVSENVSLSGPNLTVSWDPDNSSDESYTCTAENPISNVSFSVSAQSLCKGVLTKGTLIWEYIWIWIPVTVLIILVIVYTVCKYCRRKRTGSLPLLTRDPVQPQQNSMYSPGNTVYAQVIHPEHETEIPTSVTKNSTLTVYSVVNHSREKKPISPRVTTLNKNK